MTLTFSSPLQNHILGHDSLLIGKMLQNFNTRYLGSGPFNRFKISCAVWMCDTHEHVMLANIVQNDVFDRNFWTKALMMMILATRSMFLGQGIRWCHLFSPMTLTFQGHDLCRSHFGPYLSYQSAKHGQILAQGSLGKGIYIFFRLSAPCGIRGSIWPV